MTGEDALGEAAWLARGRRMACELAAVARSAGLVVTRLAPHRCLSGVEFDIALWLPDGVLWAEGTHESRAAVLRHISSGRRCMAPSPRQLVRRRVVRRWAAR